jgi:hypothetical protein
MTQDDECAVNWIMCIDTDELTYDTIQGIGDEPLAGLAGSVRAESSMHTSSKRPCEQAEPQTIDSMIDTQHWQLAQRKGAVTGMISTWRGKSGSPG